MDSKEVLTLVKNLEQNKSNDTTVIEILKQLEVGVVPTEKLLRETKVGVEVNKFKRSNNVEIAKLVKRIISSWKDAINKNKQRARLLAKEKSVSENQTSTISTTSTNDPANASASSTNGTITSTTSSTNEHNLAKDSTNNYSIEDNNNNSNNNNNKPTEKNNKYQTNKLRNSKNDGVVTNIYNDKLRDSVIRALYDALAKESDKQPRHILAISIEIEKEMNKYNGNDPTNKRYKEKYRIIYSNIISKNNKDLKFKIVDGDIKPDFLVNCDPKKLMPEHLQKELKEIHERNLFNAQGATIERSVTDRFQCGKCKERKVSYYQLQTRSADEPLTTFCTCEACGNRWKFS